MARSRITHLYIYLFTVFLIGACSGYRAETVSPEVASSNSHIRIDDMVLEKSSLHRTIKASGATAKSFYASQPWPNGVLPIKFDESVQDESLKTKFFEYCRTWESNAPVRCAPYAGQAKYMTVKNNEKGCWSSVGSQRNEANGTMNLGSDCWSQRVIVHELGHAFGLMHEHQRADRDSFIEILWENIDPDYRYAFDIISGAEHLSGYDLDSVMHYFIYAFGKDPGTQSFQMRPGYENYKYRVGWNENPSRGDYSAIQQFYAASNSQDTISAGMSLAVNASIFSADGAFRLTYQGDGNLVMYTRDGQPVWASDTFGSAGRVWMQHDGNLVIYSADDQPIWASNTSGTTASVILQNDGNLVLRSSGGEILWSTGSH